MNAMRLIQDQRNEFSSANIYWKSSVCQVCSMYAQISACNWGKNVYLTKLIMAVFFSSLFNFRQAYHHDIKFLMSEKT